MRSAQIEFFKKYSTMTESQLAGKPLYEKTIDGEVIASGYIRKVIGKTSYNAWVVEDDEGCVGILGVTDFLSEEDAENEGESV